MDFTVYGGGMDTVYFVIIASEAGADWVVDNVALEEYPCTGHSFPVEHRYIGDLVTGMLEAGLRVEWNGTECQLTSA